MGFVTKTFKDITGQTAAEAAREAGRIQAGATELGIEETRAARELGLGFLEPFQQIGAGALEQAGFLTDPTAQFEFLQQNPLFQAALEQAGRETKGFAAARGRLSAGDTLQQLSQNVLLAAQPLIAGQKQSISDLLRLGTGVAGTQAGIATGAGADISSLIGAGGAARAAGEVGAAQAGAAGTQNLLTTALLAGALFPGAGAAGAGAAAGAGSGAIGGAALSDKRLKSNIRRIGAFNGHNIYSWLWNNAAKALFGLSGHSYGVMAQEIKESNPEAVVEDCGYLKVNYDLIGVPHGN